MFPVELLLLFWQFSPLVEESADGGMRALVRLVGQDENERFQSGHRWGDVGEAATHEAPAPLREMFEVSTHQRRSLVGSLSCRTRPAS